MKISAQMRSFLKIGAAEILLAMGTNLLASEATGWLHAKGDPSFSLSTLAVISSLVSLVAGLTLGYDGVKKLLYRTRSTRAVIDPKPRKVLVINLSTIDKRPENSSKVKKKETKDRKEKEEQEQSKHEQWKDKNPESEELTSDDRRVDSKPADVPTPPTGWPWQGSMTGKNVDVFYKLSFRNLNADLDQMADLKKENPGKYRCPWEQPLRSIWHGLKTRPDQPASAKLQELIIVASEKSIKDAGCFHDLVKKYYPRLRIWFLLKQGGQSMSNTTSVPNVDSLPLHPLLQSAEQCSDIHGFNESHGWNYNDFNEMHAAFRFLIDRIVTAPVGDPFEGTRDADITIDITSGTVPVSTVAAIITVDREINTQYVATEYSAGDHRKFDILSYDIVSSAG